MSYCVRAWGCLCLGVWRGGGASRREEGLGVLERCVSVCACMCRSLGGVGTKGERRKKGY